MTKLDSTNTMKANSNIPYISMLLVIALVARITILIRQRDDSQFAAIDQIAFFHIILILLSCLLVFLHPLKSIMWKDIKTTSIYMLIAYYLISGLSLFWSPLPEYSLFRSVEYLSQIVLVITAIWFCRDFHHAERRVLWLSLITIILGACVNIKFYGFSVNISEWHTNAYSASAAMVFCYCFGELLNPNREKHRHLMIYGIAALFFLLLGTSMGSFFSAGAGIITACFVAKSGRRFFIYVLIMLFLMYLAFGFTMTMQQDIDWIRIGQDLKILSPIDQSQPVWHFRGRMYLWQHYLEAIKQNPIYGYGFATFARLYTLSVTNTHNGYLAALLGTGCIGFIFLLFFLARLYKEAMSSCQTRSMGSLGCIAALTVSVINNMSISIFGEWWGTPSLVFVAILSLHTCFSLQPESVDAKPSTSPMHRPRWYRSAPRALMPLRSPRPLVRQVPVASMHSRRRDLG